MMIILAADIPRGVTLVQCFESEFEEYCFVEGGKPDSSE